MSTILIVEDHSDIRRLIRWALDFDGHQIHEAANGTQGLLSAGVIRPELMIVDMMMPGEMNGLELTKQLRADPQLSKIGIVMLTARAQSADREAALAAGVDAFLVKPFSPIGLAAEVDRVLKARRAAQP
ncbi:response regulator [Pelomonas sp. V22]|uniref:response regulator transcription factor n=1 Tax=Pelomonas sp. V22 TaxID=2822139 RepID=UPI0024A884FF|nr:response regulator [Pelomonas sp. V22]MDI4635424.1 response regulator [Pelomonas sp. V22]